jgi:hypothetical protein
MESNSMTWNEVAASIIDDDRGKWDRKVSAEQVWVSQSGTLIAMNGGPAPDSFSLSDLATTQLCERLAIPPAYYRRLPTEMKATVANFDLKRMSERQFLLRGKASHVRAVLSGEYIAYNNSAIAETVETLLRSDGLWIKAFVLQETHCFLKIISEDLVEPMSGLKAGIMIGNSEVGMGSVSVEPFVFRKACTNDLIVTQEKAFRHAHIHFTPNELTRRMAEAIGDGFLVASQVLDAFLKAKDDPIADPLAAIRKIAEERKLSQKITDEVVARYATEPEPNRFGLINAFTRAAQSLAPLQRIEMERFAGRLLTAPLQ